MTPREMKEVSRAAKAKMANRLSIKNVYKVVVTTQKWNGCRKWKRFSVQPGWDSPLKLYFAWKHYNGDIRYPTTLAMLYRFMRIHHLGAEPYFKTLPDENEQRELLRKSLGIDGY